MNSRPIFIPERSLWKVSVYDGLRRKDCTMLNEYSDTSTPPWGVLVLKTFDTYQAALEWMKASGLILCDDNGIKVKNFTNEI